MHNKAIALGAALLLGLAGAAQAQGHAERPAQPQAHGAHAQAADQGGNAQGGNGVHGKKLFMTVGCWECHGTVGQGGPGIRLAPNPLPASVIIHYIRNPSGEMPPYAASVLNDQDVRDIRAYLATIKPPPPLADIPELQN